MLDAVVFYPEVIGKTNVIQSMCTVKCWRLFFTWGFEGNTEAITYWLCFSLMMGDIKPKLVNRDIWNYRKPCRKSNIRWSLYMCKSGKRQAVTMVTTVWQGNTVDVKKMHPFAIIPTPHECAHGNRILLPPLVIIAKLSSCGLLYRHECYWSLQGSKRAHSPKCCTIPFNTSLPSHLSPFPVNTSQDGSIK